MELYDDATRIAASDDGLPAAEGYWLLSEAESDGIGRNVPGEAEAFVMVRAEDLARLVAAADLAVESAQALRDVGLDEVDDVLLEQMQVAGIIDADGAPCEALQEAIARCGSLSGASAAHPAAAQPGCWPV